MKSYNNVKSIEPLKVLMNLKYINNVKLDFRYSFYIYYIFSIIFYNFYFKRNTNVYENEK